MHISTKKKAIRRKESPPIYWVLVGGLFLLLFFAPYSRGLFNGNQSLFEKAIYTTEIMLFILMAVFGFYASRKVEFRQRIDFVHLAVWGIPLAYLASSFVGVSSYASYIAFLIQCGCALLLIAGVYLSRLPEQAMTLASAVLVSGAALIVFGFMNWFGDASLWGLINWSETEGAVSNTYRDAVFVGPDGARLTSVFQYANSYAAYVIAMLVASLALIVHSKKLAVTAAVSALLVPAFISLLLTLSRGGLLILPVAILLVLPFLRWYRQLAALLYMGIAAVTSFVVLKPVTDFGQRLQTEFQAGTAFQAWLILLAASLLTAFIVCLGQRYLLPWAEERWNSQGDRWFANLAVPAGSVVIGTFLLYLLMGTSLLTSFLPETIRTRVENINFEQNSVLERGTFYSDAMKVVRDYPVLGAGGGAWGALYEKYQNNPYVSRQAHNYFLQVLVETGIVGLALHLLLFGLVYYHFIRSYWRKPETERTAYLVFFAFATSILLHSIIDFNMSYVYLSIVVFLCLGGMLGANELPLFAWTKPAVSNRPRYIYAFVLVAGSVALLSLSVSLLSSNAQYNEARSGAIQGKSLQEIMDPLRSAQAKFKHPEYYDLELQIYKSLYDQTKETQWKEEATRVLSEMETREPYYKPFVFKRISWSLAENDFPKAVELAEDAISNYPWEIAMYEQLATVHYLAGVYAIEQQADTTTGKASWEASFSVLERVQSKAKALESLPEAQSQGRSFGLTPKLALPLGQIKFNLGDYPAAETYLQTSLDTTFDDAGDVDAALFYLAVLDKQGKSDPGLQSTLLSMFPDDQQELLEHLALLKASTPIE